MHNHYDLAGCNLSVPEAIHAVQQGRMVLIRDDEKRKAQEKLETLLMEGIQSGEPTEMTRKDWTDIRHEALKQFEARKFRKKT